MNPPRVLWYFADPMCSWCWGFAPVVSALNDAYGDKLRLTLTMGGLRPGTKAPLTAQLREEILHHWQEVQRRSDQPFKFDDALPEGFIYDTEPASRAVVAVGALNPAAAFPYFKAVQAAFYAEGQDVTQAPILASLAERHGFDRAQFMSRFASEDIKEMTRAQFVQAAEIGIRGFPTVVLQTASDYALLTQGYRPLAELRPLIDEWLTDS